MFRRLGALVGSAFAVAIFVPLASQSPALAAGSKVVLEQFDGSGAAAFRDQVKKALGELGVDVVADKKLAATEADLGLMQASDSYAAVAKQLGATNFIKGSIKGKKPTATLTIKNSEGKKAGQKTFTGKNAAQLTAAIDKQLKKALAESLGANEGAEPVAVKEEKKAPKAEVKDAAKPAPKAQEKKEAVADKDDDDAEEKDDKEQADVSASANKESDSSDDSGANGWKGLDAAFGTYIYNRDFSYNANKLGGQQAYKTSPVAPALALALEYFVTRNIGLAAGGEFTVGLSSARGNTTFGTSSMGFYAGPKGKIHFGALELNVLAAYAKQTFILEEKVGDVFSNVPAADYSLVRGVLGARYDLGFVSVFGTLGYDHVLGMGAFTNSFSHATAAATEGSAGVIVPLGFLMKGLDLRAAFMARSYGISMNSKNGDANVAGGAVDRYAGAMLTAGYRMN